MFSYFNVVMFDLNNFELDIDDDFSSSIFSKGINSNTEKVVERKAILEKPTSKCKINESGVNLLNEQPKSSSSNHFSEALIKECQGSGLKRHQAQNEKPQKKRFSHEGLVQRKFPGPAGLLPDKPFREISDVCLQVGKPKEESEDEERDVEKSIIFSQSSGSIFLESSYRKLLSDFNLNESKNSLNRYTVDWLKRTALSKGFQGRKIPFLGLVVHSVNHTMPDPVVVLRDPTGEIHGSLHREVWADLGGKLKPGIALALRQVGVLITGVIRRQIYLNITMNNILALYGQSENENEVEITTVNKISKLELMRSSEQWLAQPPKNTPQTGAHAQANLPLFATVNDFQPSSALKKTLNGNHGARGEERKTEEVLASLGIVLDDGDFREEMTEVDPRKEPQRGPHQGLSQAESLIFEEVLQGIDLDEFET